MTRMLSRDGAVAVHKGCVGVYGHGREMEDMEEGGMKEEGKEEKGRVGVRK